MLSAGLLEEQTATLRLPEVSKRILMIVLEYIYSGKAKFSHEDAAEILSYADYFQIHALKNLCCYTLQVKYINHSHLISINYSHYNFDY